MANEIAKKENTALVNQAPEAQSQVVSGDVLIPRVLVMQGLSQFVNKRKAQQGDVMRSTNAEKLGDPDHPVEFIPLSLQSLWRLEEKVQGKYVFRGTSPRNAGNNDLPWEYKEKNGSEWRRVQEVRCFALLPKDIAGELEAMKNLAEGDMPDLDKVLLPVVFSFRSTAMNTAGKPVATHFAKVQKYANIGAKPHGYVLKMLVRQDKNDKGEFYVPEVSTGRKATADEVAKANEWVSLVTSSNLRVDEGEDGPDEAPAGSGGSSIC